MGWRRTWLTGLWATVALAAAVLGLGGCSALHGTDATRADLARDGYTSVGINLETGTGWPTNGGVVITYRHGPTGDAAEDAGNAAHIAWGTLGYRFGGLEVRTDSGGCVGSFCASRSTLQGGETSAELQAQFGPRPANLDRTSASSAAESGLAVVGIVIGVVVVVALVVVILVVVRVRSRRRRAGPPPGWGPGGPGPGWGPGGAGPGWGPGGAGPGWGPGGPPAGPGGPPPGWGPPPAAT